MWTIGLVLWLVALPCAVWPSVFPDTSHRLTLVFLSVLAGVYTCSTVRQVRPLPGLWTAFGATLAWTMLWRAWPVIYSGEYFRFFVETAAWSDGALVLCALWWGAWAWRQAPVASLRRIPLMMLVMLGVNTVFAIGQACHLPWHLGSYMVGSLTGVMGLDRLFAAYAVACLPICLAINPLLGLWPIALIFVCAKGPAWIGVIVALWAWKPRWAFIAIPVGIGLGLWATKAALWLRLTQRGLTWWHCLQATGQHPFVGWGFSPMAMTSIQTQYGYTLPSVHSDLLALAVHAGWIVCALALVVVWQLVRTPPRSINERMLRASLLGVLAISSIQSVISHSRIGSLVLLLAVWLIVERSHTKELHA